MGGEVIPNGLKPSVECLNATAHICHMNIPRLEVGPKKIRNCTSYLYINIISWDIRWSEKWLPNIRWGLNIKGIGSVAFEPPVRDGLHVTRPRMNNITSVVWENPLKTLPPLDRAFRKILRPAHAQLTQWNQLHTVCHWIQKTSCMGSVAGYEAKNEQRIFNI